MKTLKVKRRWIILMTAMTLIAVAGLAVGEPSFDCDWSVISAADVAWLITATIFVLMMTPGLSFIRSLGSDWFLAVLWRRYKRCDW